MQEKSKPPSYKEFGQFIWSDWKSRVSGSFSAPLPLFVGLVALSFAIKQDLNPIIYWTTAIGAVLFSSYRAWEIERNKLIALETKYDNREIRQAAIDKLWHYRQTGSDLRNRGNNVENEDDYKKWEAEYQQWRIDILRETDVADPNLQKWNLTVNVMDTSKMPPLTLHYKNEEFLINYMIICENLFRIEDYLKREMYLKQETYFR